MHPPEAGSQRVGVGVGKGPSGLHALKWLLDKETTLVTGGGVEQGAMVVVLVHIYPIVRWIPTPSIVTQALYLSISLFVWTLAWCLSLAHQKSQNFENRSYMISHGY